METFKTSEVGSLASWKPEGHPELLFPSQEIEIDGQKKLRGVSHICSPIFGSMPTEVKDYEGLDLPKHGFVRNPSKFTNKYSLHKIDEYVERGFQRSEVKLDFQVTNLFPWKHDVLIIVDSRADELAIEHNLIVRRSRLCSKVDDMPLSMGFHPYFATYEDPFEIAYANNFIKSSDIPHNDSFYINLDNEVLYLRMTHGTIVMSLAGGHYDKLCIWTDSNDYICIEPILGKPGNSYAMLKPGDERLGKCKLQFIPN